MTTITKLPKIKHTKDLGPCECLYTALAKTFCKTFKVQNYHINQSNVCVSMEDYALIAADAKVYAKKCYSYLNSKMLDRVVASYLLQVGPNFCDETIESGTVKLLDGWLYEREETCKTKEERCRCHPRNGSKNIKSGSSTNSTGKRTRKR